MLQDPGQFNTACSALIAFQQSALAATAGGEHLVFLGEGEPGCEVEGNMMMAVARFLKQHTKFISVLREGRLKAKAQGQRLKGKGPMAKA